MKSEGAARPKRSSSPSKSVSHTHEHRERCQSSQLRNRSACQSVPQPPTAAAFHCGAALISRAAALARRRQTSDSVNGGTQPHVWRRPGSRRVCFNFPAPLTTAPLRRVISWLRQLGARGSYMCLPLPTTRLRVCPAGPPPYGAALLRLLARLASAATASICSMSLGVKGEGPTPQGGRGAPNHVINTSNYQSLPLMLWKMTRRDT